LVPGSLSRFIHGSGARSARATSRRWHHLLLQFETRGRAEIATLSEDRKWIAASLARDPGNVWTNPELTCQHVDPEVTLAHGARAAYEVKILVFAGSLDDALKKVLSQRKGLQ